MFDHSYNPSTLSRLFRKRDFKGIPSSGWELFRFVASHGATIAAESNFGGHSPLIEFHIKKKPAYRAATLAHELVIRKLSANLRRLGRTRATNRKQLVANLQHYLEEGTPYRCYRLDVKNFYESFSTEQVLAKTVSIPGLSPMSRRHLQTLLTAFKAMGKNGVPRGLPLSAALSEIMMSKFDEAVKAKPGVYFYGRFVDDIVVITNLDESAVDFFTWAQQKLPEGLTFNNTKTSIHDVSKIAKTAPNLPFEMEYLGYCFSVSDPLAGHTSVKSGFRRVVTDIAQSKVKKIKRRLAKSLLAYVRDRDAALLIDRIKFLTSNFAVVDLNTGRKMLAGIFYGYSQLSSDATALNELDVFLRRCVLTSKSRIGKAATPVLSQGLTRALLGHSFKKGHGDRRFINFSSVRMGQIQKCWQYE